MIEAPAGVPFRARGALPPMSVTSCWARADAAVARDCRRHPLERGE